MIEIIPHRSGFIVRKPVDKYRRGTFGKKAADWLYLVIDDRVIDDSYYWETHEDFARWFPNENAAQIAVALALSIELSRP
jgi:hypothetical protein